MKVFRISSVLFLLMAACSGFLLFWTSQAVQQKESDLKNVKTQLAQEQETLRVLHVEWDYLNRPQRIEELAASQLGMALPSSTEMISNADQIPEPIIVNTNPLFFEDTGVQNVAMKPAAPVVPRAVKETVAPRTAEKQSFEKLIANIDAQGVGQ